MIRGADKEKIREQIKKSILASIRSTELDLYGNLLALFREKMFLLFVEEINAGKTGWDNENKAASIWLAVKFLTETKPTDKEDLVKIGNYCAQLYNMWDEIG